VLEYGLEVAPSVLIWSETDPHRSLMYEGEEAHR
jgi:hypothetical protein